MGRAWVKREKLPDRANEKQFAERFVRLINNDYLNSDWTGGMFETLAKNKI